MIFDILLMILIGVCLGIFTGLIPGIHINLVSLVIVSFALSLLKYVSHLEICIIIISMAVTHTFLDTIPSVFLGAPDSDTVLSVLPGHKMLLEGNGYEAVMLTVVGSLGSLMLTVALSPFLINVVGIVYPIVKDYIGFLLICASVFLIFREKKSRFWALIIFLTAGSLGLVVLNLSNLENPLFPLLSGLFGISMMALSITNNVNIPEQKFVLSEVKGVKAIFSSVIAGSLCSFMPGLGPAQAAILGSQFFKDLGSKGFLILVGGLNTVNMVFSFITLYVIEKARNGAVVAVSNIIEGISIDFLIIFLAVALVVACIATFLAVILTKIFSKIILKVNYKILCVSIIFMISVLCFFLSGFLGFLVMIISACIGLIPSMKGIGKNHLMGCLIIPVICYFVI